MAAEVGSVAPDFTLQSTDGTEVTLSALRGHPVVLYFYPKDDTPGCTAEACSFRDNLASVTATGAALLGISPDSVKSHLRFAKKFQLTFPLLADDQHLVADAYGAWVEKSMYGRKYMGVDRSTFVLDSNGVLRTEFRKVKVPGHTQEVLEALNRLG